MRFGRPQGDSGFLPNALCSIHANVARDPGRAALICGERSLTWAQLWERSNRLANSLLDLGLQRGDVVLIYMPNCLEYPEAVLALSKAGIICTFANFRLTSSEVAYQLQDSGAKAVLVRPEQMPIMQEILGDLPELRHVILVEGRAESTLAYDELLLGGSPDELEDPPTAEDVHLLMYTSGTTGRPKGAVRTFGNDYHMALAVAMQLGLGPDDVQLAAAPLYAAASAGYLFASLISGGTVVILPSFVPDQVPAAVARHQATWMFLVPIMWDWIMLLGQQELAKHDCSSLRLALACGAPLHGPTVGRVLEAFPRTEFMNWLGCSEMGFISALSYADGQKEDACVGKAIFEMELKLLTPAGDDVPQGEVGILYGRSPAIFQGYMNSPRATSEAFADSQWATVGDMARMDADGNYYLVDRAKDLIITGGTNVYPIEVEQVILGMDEVQDVAVIGVPDEKWGEAVKAVVVLAEGSQVDEQQIIDYCRGRLAGFKVPKSVDFETAIPRSMIGKALKRELRSKYWEGHEAQVS